MKYMRYCIVHSIWGVKSKLIKCRNKSFVSIFIGNSPEIAKFSLSLFKHHYNSIKFYIIILVIDTNIHIKFTYKSLYLSHPRAGSFGIQLFFFVSSIQVWFYLFSSLFLFSKCNKKRKMVSWNSHEYTYNQLVDKH